MRTVAREGFVPVGRYRTWYRVVGEGGALPLLCLHGGPGFPHDYLEPLEVLADERPVVFYDQLGCGRSDHPHEDALWTVGTFLDELRTLRAALGLTRVHLLGQSWGGMLAMEHALTRPGGLESLVLSSAPASIPRWVAETRRLKAALPPDVLATLEAHERAGTTSSREYEEAMMVFYRRHVCRLVPWPECLQRSFAQLSLDVYRSMFGPSEFYVTGTLQDWDITARLPELAVPTLVLSGRYDEATPPLMEAVHRGIRGSRWTLFEASAHLPHLEEPEAFLWEVRGFLRAVDASAGRAPRVGADAPSPGAG